MKRRRLAFAACMMAAASLASAATIPRDEWLTDMSRVWHAARLFHPVALADVKAWDDAFVRAIESVPASPTDEEMRDVLGRWLGALEDSWSGVGPFETSGAAPSTWTPALQTYAPGSHRVNLGEAPTGESLQDQLAKVKALRPALAGADAVVFDLRRPRRQAHLSILPAYLVDNSGILEPLLATRTQLPHVRWAYHSGFLPESGTSSGGYERGFRQLPLSLPFTPSGSRDARIVFIVNRHVSLPVLAVSLQREGRAAIVSEDAWLDVLDRRVPSRYFTVGGLTVRLRLGDLAWDVQPARPAQNSLAQAQEMDAAVARALAEWPPRHPVPVLDRAPPPDPPLNDRDDRLPSAAARAFAAMKAWWIFREFFPYHDLADRRWDDALKPALARVQQAATLDEYHDAINEMLAWSDDGHVSAYGAGYGRRYGASPAIGARMVEGRLVVTTLGLPAALGAAEVRVGDVIEAVDDEDVSARLDRLRKFNAVSGEAHFRNRAPALALAGPPGSSVRLRIDRGGARHEVTLRRDPVPRSQLFPPDASPVIRLLAGGIGYVDLRRLEVSDVDGMFEQLKDAPAIVFDMRGYPRGTAWSIAPRLTDVRSPAAAKFERRVAMPPADGYETYHFTQRLPPTAKARYRGKTVMLIDERAISQAEHTALFFRAANGTRFIGSSTTGANGDVTRFHLPGGLVVTFTGQRVSWPDGRQLQRRGVVPDIESMPTIDGIRAGRDEVLDKALELLAKELGGS